MTRKRTPDKAARVARFRRRLQNLYWTVYFLPCNLARSYRIARVYWGYDDSDWSTIAVLMRHQIEQTRKHIVEHDIVVGAQEAGAQMAEAVKLLDRILDGLSGYYAPEADKKYPNRESEWAELIQEMEERDMARLADILREHLRSWWD